MRGILLGQDAVTGTYIVQLDNGQKVSVPADIVMSTTPGARPSVGSPVVIDTIKLFANAIPNPAVFDSLTVPMMGAVDIISHEFYDSAAVTSAAANSIRLFITPQGSIFNGNLTVSGTLGNNERFFMTGIRFELENNDTTNPLDIVDVVQTFRLGTHYFQVGQKSYNQGKLLRFIDPETYFVVNTKYYSVKPFVTYKLDLPIAIGKQMNFFDQIDLTAATLDNTTRIFGYLKGFWYRNVQ